MDKQSSECCSKPPHRLERWKSSPCCCLCFMLELSSPQPRPQHQLPASRSLYPSSPFRRHHFRESNHCKLDVHLTGKQLEGTAAILAIGLQAGCGFMRVLLAGGYSSQATGLQPTSTDHMKSKLSLQQPGPVHLPHQAHCSADKYIGSQGLGMAPCSCIGIIQK